MLNALPQREFIAKLGGVFEHSPWVARRIVASRPFSSRLQLLQAMRAAVAEAAPEAQLALVRAHPELGGRGQSRLIAASAREQRGAGLSGCTAQENTRLEELNAAYLNRFGFPFVLAVRGHTPASILAAIEGRLANEPTLERHTALCEIGSIAAHRLAGLIVSSPGTEIVAMLEALSLASGRFAGKNALAVRQSGTAATTMVCEWLLTAGFCVKNDARGQIVGRSRVARPVAATLVAGLHYDAAADVLRYGGRMEFAVATAVALQLEQRGLSLPLDLAIVARPDDMRVGDSSSLVDGESLRGCVALRAIEGVDTVGNDARDALAALRATGVDGGSLLVVRQGRAGMSHAPDAGPDAQAAERAAGVWMDFLLRLDPRISGAERMATDD